MYLVQSLTKSNIILKAKFNVFTETWGNLLAVSHYKDQKEKCIFQFHQGTE